MPKGVYDHWRLRKGEPHHKERVRNTNIARRAAGLAFIREQKAHPCTDCGKQYPPYVMDFDHIRGDKTNDVAYFPLFSFARIAEEIAKCEVVCANCHRIRTERRRNAV